MSGKHFRVIFFINKLCYFLYINYKGRFYNV
nr:MAG TPA: hypothetical protein [Caudoviricetes sp.]